MTPIPRIYIALVSCLFVAGCIIIPLSSHPNKDEYCTVENAYLVARETGEDLIDICDASNARARAIAAERGKTYYNLSRKIELYQEMLADPELDRVVGTGSAPIPDKVLRAKIQSLVVEREQRGSMPTIVPAS